MANDNSHVERGIQDILNAFRPLSMRVSRMSDEQINEEHKAQIRLFNAMQELIDAAKNVNFSSQVQTIDVDRLEDALGDELPSESSWDEKISAARRYGEYRK